MPEFSYSNIGDVNKFNADDYPCMVAELPRMISDLQQTPVYFKKDIIVSYLKDHSVKSEWISANPILVKLMTSGALITDHLENCLKVADGTRLSVWSLSGTSRQNLTDHQQES